MFERYLKRLQERILEQLIPYGMICFNDKMEALIHGETNKGRQ